MLIPCPLCGSRDLREFTPKSGAEALDRPSPDADSSAWHAYLHLRDNPAGPSRELWYHGGGCGAWLLVERDTRTHEVLGASLVVEEESE